MKRIAIFLTICFLATFVVGPAFAYDSRYYGQPTEKWGYGGKWENENSSKGDLAKWVVIGTLGLAVLWLAVRPLVRQQTQPTPQPQAAVPPTYHPDKWPRGIEPPQQEQNQPAWQDQNRPSSATYNVADPF